MASAVSVARTARRKRCSARPLCRVYARSATVQRSSVPPSAPSCSRNAAGWCAETGSRYGPGASATGSACGAASSTRWAFVPTEAERADAGQRRRAARGQGQRRRPRGSRCRSARPIVRVGLARSAGAAGSRRAGATSTTLISPAMPAAASRWPMLVLTEPIAQRPSPARPAPQHRGQRLRPRSGRRAACRCRAPRRSRPACRRDPASAQRARGSPPLRRRRSARSGRCCAPSWLTADAADHARDRVAVGAARRDSRFSTTTPHALAAHEAVGARRRTSCTGRPARASRVCDRLHVDLRARASG